MMLGAMLTYPMKAKEGIRKGAGNVVTMRDKS